MTGHKKDTPFWTMFIFILASMLGFALICGCTGCLGSPPVYKKAPRQPLPKESFESEERTRQAVTAVCQWLISLEVPCDMIPLVKALVAKVGIPTQALIISKETLGILAEKLLQDTADMRKKQKEWENEFDKDATFEQGKQSFASRVKSNFNLLLIIFIIACIAFPAFGVGVIRFIKARLKKAKEVYEKEFDINKRKAEQTEKAVKEFKEKEPDLWPKIEPFLKEAHDQDIQENIKNNNK